MDELLGKKHGVGHIQPTSVDDYAFDDQYHSFQRSGYVVDLGSHKVIGNIENYEKEQKAEIGAYNGNKTEAKKNKRKLKDVILGDEEDDEAGGPWAAYKEEKPVAQPQLLPAGGVVATSGVSSKPLITNYEEKPLPPNTYIIEPEEEDEKWERKNEKKLSFVLPHRPTRGSIPLEATTQFHGESTTDFQGRSWVLPPQGIHPTDDFENFNCYIPKKCVHRLTDHTKGVQQIEYFPQYGHLLLSASMDGTAKIWDSQQSYKLLRTYTGHAEGIRSMKMSNDGKHFLTAAFDRYIRHWDTETGQCVATFTNRKMGYNVKYYPRDNNIFLIPSSDNKIYQWDIRSGEICQVYNYHLAAANTVTFFDDDKKFISTSDDKKVLVWEYDIPVPIKYIQDQDIHSMPSVTAHPTEPFVAGQSMDNKIVVYSAGEKVKWIRKKNFKGHNNSGYACQIGFSLNGQFIMSGDGLGQLFFWDWKTGKIYRKFQAHDGGPCMNTIWHPLHANRVATCGWDGFIKIWE
jgi:pre-mRNA-processing factor 17